jgi:cytochrome bd-type quinol oxidase subunit 2
MVKSGARTQALLRQKSRQRRALQVWIALTVIWGVVLGWVVFGIVNSVTDDADVPLAWWVYAVPLVALAVGTLIAYLRLRRSGAELLALAEAEQAAREGRSHPS